MRTDGFSVLRQTRTAKVDLEPLAEVERALLVVQVLKAPGPELGGLLLSLGEHSAHKRTFSAHNRTFSGEHFQQSKLFY